MKEDDEIKLSRYLDRELNPEESQEIEARIKKDPEAGHVLEDWQQIGGILRDSVADMPAPDPGETWQMIKMEITGQHPAVPIPTTLRAPRPRWLPGLIALLASLALAAAAWWFLLRA